MKLRNLSYWTVLFAVSLLQAMEPPARPDVAIDVGTIEKAAVEREIESKVAAIWDLRTGSFADNMKFMKEYLAELPEDLIPTIRVLDEQEIVYILSTKPHFDEHIDHEITSLGYSTENKTEFCVCLECKTENKMCVYGYKITPKPYSFISKPCSLTFDANYVLIVCDAQDQLRLALNETRPFNLYQRIYILAVNYLQSFVREHLQNAKKENSAKIRTFIDEATRYLFASDVLKTFKMRSTQFPVTFFPYRIVTHLELVINKIRENVGLPIFDIVKRPDKEPESTFHPVFKKKDLRL